MSRLIGQYIPPRPSARDPQRRGDAMIHTRTDAVVEKAGVRPYDSDGHGIGPRAGLWWVTVGGHLASRRGPWWAVLPRGRVRFSR